LNSLALGFITDIDEILISNIVNYFPDEAVVAVSFDPICNPMNLYDEMGGPFGSIAQKVIRAYGHLIRFHVLQLIIALPALNLNLELFASLGWDGFNVPFEFFANGPFIFFGPFALVFAAVVMLPGVKENSATTSAMTEVAGEAASGNNDDPPLKL